MKNYIFSFPVPSWRENCMEPLDSDDPSSIPEVSRRWASTLAAIVPSYCWTPSMNNVSFSPGAGWQCIPEAPPEARVGWEKEETVCNTKPFMCHYNMHHPCPLLALWTGIVSWSCVFLCVQVGYTADSGAAHVSAFAAAHEQEEGQRAGGGTWALLLLPRLRGRYVGEPLHAIHSGGMLHQWLVLVLLWLETPDLMFLVLSFLPVESIVITPFLPVVVFGRPLPKLTQQ